MRPKIVRYNVHYHVQLVRDSVEKAYRAIIVNATDGQTNGPINGHSN